MASVSYQTDVAASYLTARAHISHANGLVVKAAIHALDDEDAQAAALYLEAAALFRQAGNHDWANEAERLAADCIFVVAEAG